MSDPQPRPSLDRSLLIPVGIIIVSILGICLIFSTAGLGVTGSPPTASPSSFSPPATRTWTPSPSVTVTLEETPAPTVTLIREEAPTAADGTGPASYPGPPAETLPPTGTLTETPVTPSATLTPSGIQPFPAGRYDDTDPNIAYGPNWTGLKNASTAISYKGTIHASASIGNEASFRFTGERLRLGYQRGKSFGTVTVLIDDQSYSFHQQAFDLVWRSPELSPGEHFVRIVHESGESINLDYIEILD